MRKMGKDIFETKLLSVDRDPGGGYWVKPEMSNRIIGFVRETSPIRQFATVETIGTDALEMITDLGQAGFGWVPGAVMISTVCPLCRGSLSGASRRLMRQATQELPTSV